MPWMRGERLQDAPAYLTRLSSNGEALTGRPIPLTEKENTFGLDPIQSENVLDHPSIAALHALINRTAGGDFLLLDDTGYAGQDFAHHFVVDGAQPLGHIFGRDALAPLFPD